MINDPFTLFSMPDEAWPPGVDPVSEAVALFDQTNPSPLIRLLESTDPIASRRGLRVFAELGRRGAVVLDAALSCYAHPDNMARNALMDGVICYSSCLNAEQAGTILKLVNDPFELVREKVIVFLANANIESLRCAVAALEEPLRSEHRNGLIELTAEHRDTQLMFDRAVARNDIWSTYALASFERMARIGTMARSPEFFGESYIGNAVVAHVKMHILRASRPKKRKGTDPAQ